MKKNFYNLFVIFSLVILVSCNSDEIPNPFPSELVKGCYVINYGSFGQGGASISKYDYETGDIANFYYKSQNNGTELLSNIQHACYFNDSVYLVGNVADQLITLNPLFKQSRNAYSNQLHNPRFCIGHGNYLYISCLGVNPDFLLMPDSYVAKYNLSTSEVEKIIDVPGGPEGMEIANGKLYVALNYKKQIAVINLANDGLTYIETPAVTSYFVKDANENLYVSLLSTWTNFSDNTGLGLVNTNSDELTQTFNLDNVSSSYGWMMQTNADKSKIYVVTSSYDANWNLSGSVATFNVSLKSFSAEPLVNNVTGISGIALNPKNNDLYVFSAESTTGIGQMDIYSSTGALINTLQVGAFPIGAIFIE